MYYNIIYNIYIYISKLLGIFCLCAPILLLTLSLKSLLDDTSITQNLKYTFKNTCMIKHDRLNSYLVKTFNDPFLNY